MDYYFQLAFFAIFVLVIGRFLYGRLKYGSWTGSFLKGSIDRTIGEVKLSAGLGGTHALKIQTLRNDEDDARFVALVVVSKAFLAASMQPYRLTKAQARELAKLLTQAAQ